MTRESISILESIEYEVAGTGRPQPLCLWKLKQGLVEGGRMQGGGVEDGGVG